MTLCECIFRWMEFSYLFLECIEKRIIGRDWRRDRNAEQMEKCIRCSKLWKFQFELTKRGFKGEELEKLTISKYFQVKIFGWTTRSKFMDMIINVEEGVILVRFFRTRFFLTFVVLESWGNEGGFVPIESGGDDVLKCGPGHSRQNSERGGLPITRRIRVLQWSRCER